MSTVAIYRILYGQDFLCESIDSVLPVVDNVVVFWSDRWWGAPEPNGAERVSCNVPALDDALSYIPNEPFDAWQERLLTHTPRDLGDREVNVDFIYDHVSDPMNQFTHLVNDHVIPEYGKPDELLIMEPDLVFRDDQLERALTEFRNNGYTAAKTRQIELWREPCWRVPERPNRTGAVLWNLKRLHEMPPTQRQGEPRGTAFETIKAYVHNFGFCNSDPTMRLKHLAAILFSETIGDSIPNTSWLDDKWRAWTAENQLEHLEISRGHEHMIPRAVPYDTTQLPESIRLRYDYA